MCIKQHRTTDFSIMCFLTFILKSRYKYFDKLTRWVVAHGAIRTGFGAFLAQTKVATVCYAIRWSLFAGQAGQSMGWVCFNELSLEKTLAFTLYFRDISNPLDELVRKEQRECYNAHSNYNVPTVLTQPNLKVSL